MKGKLSLLSSALFAQRVFLVLGLKLENFSVPIHGVKNKEAVLLCEFSLGSDTLQSLKWYKDGHEFFRYTPQPSNYLTFTVSGVTVDLKNSNMNKVELKNISLNSGGTYKCEVSADRPYFQTLSQQGDMIVIAPPKENPKITGVRSMMSVGDTLVSNCTCYQTKPAASLMFYINDEKTDDHLIEYSPTTDPDGLETAVLGLNIQIESRHFKKEKLDLKCTATIGNGYWMTTKTIPETKINAQPTGHNHKQLASGGAGRKSEYYVSTASLTIFMVFIYNYDKYN